MSLALYPSRVRSSEVLGCSSRPSALPRDFCLGTFAKSRAIRRLQIIVISMPGEVWPKPSIFMGKGHCPSPVEQADKVVRDRDACWTLVSDQALIFLIR